MILIIGGGIIGTSIAYFLSRSGVSDISLIEKEKLQGMGATQFCSGGIRAQFTTPINVQFSKESLKDLSSWEIDFKKLGYLILDTENDSRARVLMQNKMGVASCYLTPMDLKQRFPYINIEGVISASFCAEDGIADPSKLLAIYGKGARQNGVKLVSDTRVEKILKKDGRVCGVGLNDREVIADLVILAAGVQSKELGATIGLDIPIVKRRKYVLVTNGFGFDFPLVMEIPLGWYIKKEGEDLLLGMSGKVEQIDYEKKQEAVDETIEASFYRFPKTENCSIKKVISCMSDETPDKHAIIDNSIPGLIVATGFSGHGFMHSPAVGRVVSAMVKGEAPLIDASELKLGRKQIREPLVI